MTEKKSTQDTDNPFEDILGDKADTSADTSADSADEKAPVEETQKPAPKKSTPRKKKPAGLDHSKMPVTIIQGGLQGSITLQNGRPVLKVSPRPWIGEEPLVLAEGQLDDLIELLDQIKKESR